MKFLTEGDTTRLYPVTMADRRNLERDFAHLVPFDHVCLTQKAFEEWCEVPHEPAIALDRLAY